MHYKLSSSELSRRYANRTRANTPSTMVYILLTLNDVRCHADVDKEELREFIPRDIPFWQHPAAQDENKQKELLNHHHPLLRSHCYWHRDLEDK